MCIRDSYEDYDAICRNVRFVNNGEQNLDLLRAMSMSVDLYDSDFETVSYTHLDVYKRQLRKDIVTDATNVKAMKKILPYL